MPRTKFIDLKCPRCNNSQTVYSRATLRIKCNQCNRLLIKPTGGKTKMRAKVNKVLSLPRN